MWYVNVHQCWHLSDWRRRWRSLQSQCRVCSVVRECTSMLAPQWLTKKTKVSPESVQGMQCGTWMYINAGTSVTDEEDEGLPTVGLGGLNRQYGMWNTSMLAPHWLMKETKVSLDSALEARAGSMGVSLRSSFFARWTRTDIRLCWKTKQLLNTLSLAAELQSCTINTHSHDFTSMHTSKLQTWCNDKNNCHSEHRCW